MNKIFRREEAMPIEELPAARIYKYEFEVPIKRPASKVWSLMTDKINSWWMNDFRALGEGSTMSLNAHTGGMLVEQNQNGDSLEWYRVQMCQPEKALYLNGYLAPDWGGPTLSMLKLALEPEEGACVLKVSDALMGNVTEASAKSAQSGWEMMFRDGLGHFAER